MQVWLAQVLLSGFLDRYDRLKMAVFESNAEWLPYILETCDRLYKLYASERDVAGDRLPSQAFAEQCVISFESDEVGVFEQWGDFENVGIWASDAYHHDGADVWSAMRNMTEAGVPEAVQAKLLGANGAAGTASSPRCSSPMKPARSSDPTGSRGGPELAEWADIVAHPRENADELAAMGLDPVGGRSIVARRRPAANGVATDGRGGRGDRLGQSRLRAGGGVGRFRPPNRWPQRLEVGSAFRCRDLVRSTPDRCARRSLERV